MRGKDLLDAMNELDDGILEETRKGRNRHQRVSKRLVASAVACFVSVAAIFAVSVLPRWMQEDGGNTAQNEGDEQYGEYVVDKNASMVQLYNSLDMDWSNCAGVVSIEAVRDLHIKYINMHNENLATYSEEPEEFRKLFYSCMQEWKTDFLDTADYETAQLTTQRYLVKNDSGEIAYYCYGMEPGTDADAFLPKLVSIFTGESYTLGEGSSADFSAFVSNTNQKQESVVEAAEYVFRAMDATEYGGIKYDVSEEALCVWLADERYRSKLEAKGVICKAATLTLAEQYEKMHEIWQHREELELTDIYWSYELDKIVVVSGSEEEKFRKVLGAHQDVIAYEKNSDRTANQKYPQIFMGYSGAREITDLDTFIDYLQEMDRVYGAYTDARSDYYERLHIALEKLKGEYPEYTYLQLYYHVAADCDYEWYMDFDEELETFAETISKYQSEFNFFAEQEFGDPECLELKGLLRAYKELNPQYTYEQIYEQYEILKNIEQEKYMAAQERLYRRLMDKYAMKGQVLQVRAEREAEQRANILKIAGIVGSIIAAGVLVYMVIRWIQKKPLSKKAEWEFAFAQERGRITILLIGLLLALMPNGEIWNIGKESILSYVYVAVALWLLLLCVRSTIKGGEVQSMIRVLSVALLVVAVLQVVMRFDYRSIYPQEMDISKNMSGVVLVHLCIAIAFYVSLYGRPREQMPGGRMMMFRELITFWLYFMTLYDVCFGQLVESRWEYLNVFFTEQMWKYYGMEASVIRIIVVTVLFVVAGIVLMLVKEPMRQELTKKLQSLRRAVTIQYFLWILCMGTLTLWMQDSVRYFMPGAVHILLMAWGGWRISGADEKKLW